MSNQMSKCFSLPSHKVKSLFFHLYGLLLFSFGLYLKLDLLKGKSTHILLICLCFMLCISYVSVTKFFGNLQLFCYLDLKAFLLPQSKTGFVPNAKTCL